MENKIDYVSINANIYDNFGRIVDLFNLNLRPDGQLWRGTCFHPGADNPTAMAVYPTGTWRCWTRGCQERRHDLVGLLRQLLKKYLSIGGNDEFIIQWYVDNILEGQSVFDIPKQNREQAVYQYVPRVFFPNLNEWRGFVQCPSEEYIRLGFADWVVNEYNIGTCYHKSSNFYNRIVVPHIDTTGRVIGYSGRSLYNKCPYCKFYHSHLEPCPTEYRSPKWQHAKHFKTSYNLFNSWHLSWPVTDIILVESIGNTLKLRMAGVYNVCCLYGNTLSLGQAQLLEEMGVQRITWVADRDLHQAGWQGALKSEDRFRQFLFRIVLPPIGTKDVGEMHTDTLKQWLSMQSIKGY